MWVVGVWGERDGVWVWRESGGVGEGGLIVCGCQGRNSMSYDYCKQSSYQARYLHLPVRNLLHDSIVAHIPYMYNISFTPDNTCM